MTDRSKLPYRETTDAFLIYNGKLLSLDKGRYMLFPGGGVDPGETPIQAVRREIKEEVGCKVDKLSLVATIDSDWFPEWADTEKRKRDISSLGESVLIYLLALLKTLESQQVLREMHGHHLLLNICYQSII